MKASALSKPTLTCEKRRERKLLGSLRPVQANEAHSGDLNIYIGSIKAIPCDLKKMIREKREGRLQESPRHLLKAEEKIPGLLASRKPKGNARKRAAKKAKRQAAAASKAPGRSGWSYNNRH
jgi:hypothetical protein